MAISLHTESVTPLLLETAEKTLAIPEISPYRLVGGTALSLRFGHRKSVDIDLFASDKLNKREIAQAITDAFPGSRLDITEHNVKGVINGIKIELFDGWHAPFQEQPITIQGIRMATLMDIACLKLDAIIERREKKDYIDLYFLFKELTSEKIFRAYNKFNPLVSDRSFLFALNEVNTARDNKSIMPELIRAVSWKEIADTMYNITRKYLNRQNGNDFQMSM
ncbi:MAG: nucleotidyl transferase AbiEii/AbiGii toxin family protein [Flammeovirgaceae bacterium]